MIAIDSTRRRSPSALLLAAAAFGLVFGLAWFAIEVSRNAGRVSAIWWANAVLLSLMLGARPRQWPLLLAAGLAGNVSANLLSGDTPAAAGVLSLCNSLEVLICAYGLRALVGRVVDLTRRRAFAAFAFLCIAGPLASGFAAGAYLRLSGQGPGWTSTGIWMLADSLGLFILTPALLVLGRRKNRLRLIQAVRQRRPVLWIVFAALLAASVVGPWHSAFLLSPPVLVLITLEYQLAGAAAAMLILSLFAYGMFLIGLEPTVLVGDGRGRLLRLQVFLALLATVVLPLGSVVVQRAKWRREIAAARDRAEASAAAKSEFLANMSHELRTPLTAIIGFAGLLRGDDGLNERQVRYVRRIADASQALLAVINDVLDFSKLEAGELALDPQSTDPAHVIRQTASLVSLQADAKQLRLVVCADGLPAAVMLDEGRLRQVMLNLLSNAVKFTEAGEIRVTASHAAGRLAVAVSDTGPGIPADSLDRLFQRFSQADGSISRRYGGTGLGLAICRRLVTLMGGRIGVETVVGQGSTFTFDIAAPQTEGAVADEAREATADGPPISVLLVEDAAANRELVGTLLQTLGASVAEAVDGEAGLAAARSARFDLILMDVRMAGIDGLEAARTIRREEGPNRHTPILALTADVQQADIEACRAAGMNDHVAKPVAVADLLAKTIRWSRMPRSAEPAP